MVCSAKNVALAGVKSVTIYDPSRVEIADLGTQVGPVYLPHPLQPADRLL
jgi:molybdopterin/thiamine biosynthesis adenylyltransferase